ncbi:hypothetical protein QVD17_25295 [Tagetes erecta]|uniref:FBD domain-containing protein n=1 Tax=Tagetes erecta TaxID=13708 RepID=A0AAD8KMH7_TARER|nr:hypothetical protein QVD17_25295 [Tagetes erecta]
MTPSLHDKDCTIIELFKCLTMIEHLTTWHHIFPWLVQDAVPKGLATSLFHLKYFCLKVTCLYDRYGLAFLLALIRSSPNLEKLKIEISWHNESDDDYSVGWEKYSDVWLEHLTELQISDFGNAKPEMEFVKFILARSPKLKKVNIAIFRVVRWPEVSDIFQTLLQAPRASPVTITFEYDPY